MPTGLDYGQYPFASITDYVEGAGGFLWGVCYIVGSCQTTGCKHRDGSLHYDRRALDLPPTRRNWEILEEFGKSGVLEELYWRSVSPNYRRGRAIGPTDKTNHIHAGLAKGRLLIAKAAPVVNIAWVAAANEE